MNELRDRISKLSVSRPVFILRKGPAWRPDSYELQTMFPAGNAVSKEDIVGQIVTQNAHERFDLETGKYEIDVDQTINTINQKVLYRISNFVENSCGMEKPHLSKLYKWYSDRASQIHDNNFKESLFMLYKYIESNKGADTDSPHVKNIMGILEILMSKYGEKDGT